MAQQQVVPPTQVNTIIHCGSAAMTQWTQVVGIAGVIAVRKRCLQHHAAKGAATALSFEALSLRFP
jgi:hypothetical protein